MIGGAVSGAILGAIDGGLEGALRGAAWGAGIGGILGAGYGMGLGGYFAAGVAIGGAAYAGATGGLEGLGDFAAGGVGAFYGASLGNALVNPSQYSQTETQTSLSESEQQETIQERNSGQLTDPSGNTDSSTPSILKNNENARITADLATKGKVGAGSNSLNDDLSWGTELKNLVNESVEAAKITRDYLRSNRGALVIDKALTPKKTYVIDTGFVEDIRIWLGEKLYGTTPQDMYNLFYYGIETLRYYIAPFL